MSETHSAESDAARLAALLGEHTTFGRSEQIHPKDGPNCGWAVVRACRCGKWSAPVMVDDSDREGHRMHLAVEIIRSATR
jgi:hypothetical protein